MTAAPISLVSPVAGIIHGPTWVRPAGNHDWKVTKTAAQHVAAGGPPAIDLGHGENDLPPAYSIISGAVALHRAGDGVIIVRGVDGAWETVHAHLNIDATWGSWYVGRSAPIAAVLGHVDSTIPPPASILAHLHLQVGHHVVNNVGWVDPWPLLVITQRGVLNGANIHIRSTPSLSGAIYAESRPSGIYRNGIYLCPLGQRMPVRQPTFRVADGYTWVALTLLGVPVWVAKPLLHFELA